MNIFVLSFDVDGFIHPAVTRLVRHGVLDAPRTHWAIADRDRSSAHFFPIPIHRSRKAICVDLSERLMQVMVSPNKLVK